MTVKRYEFEDYGTEESQGRYVTHEDYAALLTALLKERDALAVDSIQLRQFFAYCIESAFEGCNLDGGDIQEKALELGLVREESYQSEKHGSLVSDSGYFEDGDSIYIVNEQTNVDAATAVIQAHGVDRLADHLSGLNIMASETSVREFAEQLRKEAAHD